MSAIELSQLSDFAAIMIVPLITVCAIVGLMDSRSRGFVFCLFLLFADIAAMFWLGEEPDSKSSAMFYGILSAAFLAFLLLDFIISGIIDLIFWIVNRKK